MNKRIFFVVLFVALIASQLRAQSSYYSAIDGVRGGAQLKDALYNLIKNHSIIDYGSGENSTWWAFYVTDALPGTQKRVADMYSSTKRYFGERGASVKDMHIEHSVPKSWWGGDTNDAYYDLHHLNPSDATANMRKSNHPLGKLLSVTWTNSVSSIGEALVDGSPQTAFEPADEYKGDFARTYMYMFTCYQNLNWEYTYMNYAKSSYPTLKKWAVELLLEWHTKDPVSEKEILRNNAVYSIQNNRNPFVDYPNLAYYVWGDSVDYIYNVKELPDAGNDNDDAVATGGSYVLVNSVSDLEIGSTIIIANGGNAISTTQKTNNRAVAAVTVSGKYITGTADNVQTILLEKGYADGTFAFNVGNGYLCASSSTLNQLTTSSVLDANSSWRIAFAADGAATIVAQGENTRNSLRYNSASKLFSCYASGQQPVYIYVEYSDTTGVEQVMNDDGVVDVYSVAGVLVRKGVKRDEALKGLARGVYMINNKKFLVK